MNRGRRARASRRERGYTLVEVMTATVILIGCAAGILGLQATVTRANMIAREIATASTIAATWEERVKLDAMRWAESSDPMTMLAQTRWLNEANNRPNQWVIPAVADGMDDGFAYNGVQTAVAGEERFCVNLRLNWHRNAGSGACVRVDIRVWSFADAQGVKRGQSGNIGTEVDLSGLYDNHCAQANLAAIDLPEPAAGASAAQLEMRRNFRIFQTTVDVRRP